MTPITRQAAPGGAPDFEKETRFAVVMYGGISLAIYIHGAAHELYSLARATARNETNNDYLIPDQNLEGAELVYRKLGEMLKTRFVVDILSGTSAGGINAVFLAKALVNNQSMDALKTLWVDEGDISLLINDGESLRGLGGIKLQTPPSSLLNNQRMYYKLLEAFRKMNAASPATFSGISPYAQELDLSITASDIRGLVLPLGDVANAKINEARYKSVFQFHYSTKKAAGDSSSLPGGQNTNSEIYSNDFTKDFDPFLAFAARCTSSIPPAFEPMQLNDIEPILKTAAFKNEYSYDPTVWKNIYRDYFDAGDDFPLRSFGDGGYLDNKPFSYATQTLLRRRADVPVDRKLIYIEPAPEHPEDQPLSTARPDLLENVLAALIVLPRSETIREDLNAIAERNKVIERIRELTGDIGNMAFLKSRIRPAQKDGNKSLKQPFWLSGRAWAQKYLMEHDVLSWYGPGYAAYHQARMASVLDDLTAAISRNLGFGGSELRKKELRHLLDLWRNKNYSIQSEKGKYSESDILFRLDIPWRLRQINFLQTLLDEILTNLDSFETPAGKDKDNSTRAMKFVAASGVDLRVKSNERPYYLQALKWLKGELNNALVYLRARGRLLRSRDLADWPSAEIAQIGELGDYAAQLQELRSYFNAPHQDEDAGVALIERLTASLASHLNAAKSRGYIFQTLRENSNHVRDALAVPRGDRRIQTLASEKQLFKDARKPGFDSQPEILRDALDAARKILAFYFDHFEYYDMLTFPLQFGTDVGETDLVEVIRVSPEDATSIINERESGRHKLAGIKLASFGAFFEKEWRQNDMLWGRLDAAEILIRELLKGSCRDESEYDRRLKEFSDLCKSIPLNKPPSADSSQATALLEEAQIPLPLKLAFEAILNEDLRPRDRSLLYQFLGGNLPAREKPPAENSVPEKNDLLRKLNARNDELKQLEGDLYQIIRKRLGAGAHPLRAEVMRLIEKERENLEIQIRNQEEKSAKESSMAREALNKMDEQKTPIPLIARIMRRLRKTDAPRYRDLMRSITRDDDELLAYFKYGYQINAGFQPKPTLRIASRAARVLAGLTEGLSAKYSILKGPAGFVLALSRVFVALVEAVLAPTIATVIFMFFYIVGMALFAGGLYFKFNDAQTIGAYTFGLTLLAQLLFYLVDGFVYGLIPIGRLAKLASGLIVLFILAILALAYLELLHLGILRAPPGILEQWLAPLFK